MKSVLISIQPKWCELIASGRKTVEVRKTKPKLETPFKVYIYRTKGSVKHLCDGKWWNMPVGGTVIGEFVCDNVGGILPVLGGVVSNGVDIKETCLTTEQITQYLKAKRGYGWHISGLVIYDKPKELSEFRYYNTSVKLENGYPMPTHEITRPPQSWCYVEEYTEGNE